MFREAAINPASPVNSKSEQSVRRAALTIAVLGGFLTPFMGSAVNIALPSIGREFSLHAVGLGWVATAYLLTAATFLLPFGRLADIIGRKKIYAWGLALYTLASLLCGLAPAAPLLIGFRALQGLGGAMIFGTAVAILSSVFPAQERGRVLGISVASTYLGLSVGPVAGGLLTQFLGWRSIFYANVPIGLLVLLLLVWKLKGEWAEARGERFDLSGSVLYGLALIALIYGFSRLPGWLGAACLLAAGFGFWAFVRWERATPQPVLHLDLFRNRVFAFSSLAALINYSATFAVGFLLSLYLQYIKGLPPQTAGLVLIVQPVFMAVFSPLAGRLSDRIEARLVASLGMAFTAAGMLLLLLLGQGTPLWFVLVSLVFMGFGFALFSSPNTNAVMGSLERRFYGVGSATLGTMRLTGQMFSLAITMLVMALYFGDAPITAESHGLFLASMRAAFAVFSALCAAGVLASLARGSNSAGKQT